MPASDFRTIPDELLHVAEAAEQYYQNQGYEVALEQREIGFPFVPALVCRRGHETVIVEVMSDLERGRIERWLRYGKSQTVDTRLCVFVRRQGMLTAEELQYAITAKLGVQVHDDTSCLEVRAPSDLAVHVALPDLADLKPAVRPLLGSAFKKVNENDWRDGLGEAYLEIEQHARDYLKVGMQSGRIVIQKTKRGQPTGYVVTDAEVDKMTLGQLKDAFARIQNQNFKDSTIGSTLAMINKTRVGLAHKRRAKAVEAELRQQVGQHMHAVISCLEELIS